jgi:hypothetical protein
MSNSDKSLDLKKWADSIARNMEMFKEGAEMMVRDHQSQPNTRQNRTSDSRWGQQDGCASRAFVCVRRTDLIVCAVLACVLLLF